MAKGFVISVADSVAQKVAPLVADFTPITAVVMSLFGLIILMGILKKFGKM